MLTGGEERGSEREGKPALTANGIDSDCVSVYNVGNGYLIGANDCLSLIQSHSITLHGDNHKELMLYYAHCDVCSR